MKPFASSLLPIFALLQFLGRTASIPLDQFYAYGPEAGDDELVRNDDESSSTLTLPVPFPFFDEEERTLFVSNCDRHQCLCLIGSGLRWQRIVYSMRNNTWEGLLMFSVYP